MTLVTTVAAVTPIPIEPRGQDENTCRLVNEAEAGHMLDSLFPRLPNTLAWYSILDCLPESPGLRRW